MPSTPLARALIARAVSLVAIAGATTAQIVPRNGAYDIDTAGATLATFASPALGGLYPAVTVTVQADGWERVRMVWNLPNAVQQDDVAIEFALGIQPDFQWLPHLAPLPGLVCAQDVFRSPALIVAQGTQTLAIVPDLELCGTQTAGSWYLDYDAPARRAWLGLSAVTIPAHVLFAKAPGMRLGPGTVELGFFARAYADHGSPPNPWRETSRFLWQRYARPLLAAGQPHRVPLARLTDTAYEWAFDRWKKPAWAEDTTGTVGAPQVLVDYTQSPTYPSYPAVTRDPQLWNQAWFSAIRTASGMKRWSAPLSLELPRRAAMTKELTLAAPNGRGIFPAVLRGSNTRVENRFDLRRARWGNSDRVPTELGITTDWYHVADASTTALWLLRWYRELEQDQRVLDYIHVYAKWLLAQQRPDGFFPAWVHPTTMAPSPVLFDSPETSVSATLLLEFADVVGDVTFATAGIAAIDAVISGPAAEGRWEDFETYWSDNDIGRLSHIGQRYARNGVFKQNTLSMFWTAEALLRAHATTGDARYLAWAERTTDELSMHQQVWQPPFCYVPCLGGFGVMNADNEWNDARQSLFAELYLDLYRATGDAQQFERGIAALKASFAMMYTPLLPATFLQWEGAFPTLGPSDYGFMMENYGHGTPPGPNGEGIGFFAIFSWGAGSASEAYARIRDHYGDVFIDRARSIGFGLDSIDVVRVANHYRLTDRAGQTRKVRIVFDDGTSQQIWLTNTANVQ